MIQQISELISTKKVWMKKKMVLNENFLSSTQQKQVRKNRI